MSLQEHGGQSQGGGMQDQESVIGHLQGHAMSEREIEQVLQYGISMQQAGQEQQQQQQQQQQEQQQQQQRQQAMNAVQHTLDHHQVGSMRFGGQHGTPMQGMGTGMDGMMYGGMMAQAQAAQHQMHDQEMGSLNGRARHDQDIGSTMSQSFHGRMSSHAIGLSSGMNDSQGSQISSVGGMVGGGGGLVMKQMGPGSLSDGLGMGRGGGVAGAGKMGVSRNGGSSGMARAGSSVVSSGGGDNMMVYGGVRGGSSASSGGNLGSAASFGDEHKVNQHQHQRHVDTSMPDVDAGTNNPGAMPHVGNASRMLGTGRQGRHHPGNPVIKLSVKLLDTYKNINDKYYTRQKSKVATKQQTQNRMLYNDGYDDEAGDYIVREGDIIHDRYKISVRPGSKTPLLGRGSFGQVAYAYDMTENLGVAIKIIKNQKHFHEQAKTEIELLKRFLLVPRLQRIPVPPSDYNRESYLPCTEFVEQANTVRLLDTFVHKCHQCLVFEILPLSLYDLLKFSKFKGFSLSLVRKLTRNILFNLASLRQANVDVIHCDLKPENVMLIKHNEYRLKVIDFGSSCSSSNKPFSYIQSRFYRSPEVLLCRDYSYAIDMWSLGCIMAEMHTGSPLFNGKNEFEQMIKITQMLGLPPDHMVASAGSKSKVKNMFRKVDGVWMLKLPNESYVQHTPRALAMSIRKPNSQESEQDYADMESLLSGMLAIDPDERFTPKQALHHPFFVRSNAS